MGLLDMLQGTLAGKLGQAAPPATGVTQNDSVGSIAASLAQAMHSRDTPPFGDMVGQMFGSSNAGQQAGLLNHLLGALGPAALSGVAGGVLGKLLSPGQTQLTPEQAAQVSPADASALAAYAEQTQPGIVDQVAQFYAQNSSVINGLGAAALAFVVTKMNEGKKTA